MPLGTLPPLKPSHTGWGHSTAPLGTPPAQAKLLWIQCFSMAAVKHIPPLTRRLQMEPGTEDPNRSSGQSVTSPSKVAWLL